MNPESGLHAPAAGAYPPSSFNPLTPGASLDAFETPLVRAEYYRSPHVHHLQVRQYGGNFDEGENLFYLEIPAETGPRMQFDPAVMGAALHEAGWLVTGPWSRGDRGGLDAVVAAL